MWYGKISGTHWCWNVLLAFTIIEKSYLHSEASGVLQVVVKISVIDSVGAMTIMVYLKIEIKQKW